ncbi:14480_t:CDS:2, partial [Dentiscutata erythropus]
AFSLSPQSSIECSSHRAYGKIQKIPHVISKKNQIKGIVGSLISKLEISDMYLLGHCETHESQDLLINIVPVYDGIIGFCYRDTLFALLEGFEGAEGSNV